MKLRKLLAVPAALLSILTATAAQAVTAVPCVSGTDILKMANPVNANTAATVQMTVNQNASIGEFICVMTTTSGTVAIAAPTDSGSNTWTALGASIGTSLRFQTYCSTLTTAMTSGVSTVNANTTGANAGTISITTYKLLGGFTTLDQYGPQNSGSGTTNGSVTGTMTQATEIIIGFIRFNSSSGPYTEDPVQFLEVANLTSGTFLRLACSKATSASGATVTWGSTWPTSVGWVATLDTFYGGAAAAPAKRGLLLGVGN